MRTRAYVGDVACVTTCARAGVVLAGVGSRVRAYALDAHARVLTPVDACDALEDGARVHGARAIANGTTCVAFGARRMRVLTWTVDGASGAGRWRADASPPAFASWVHDAREMRTPERGYAVTIAVGLSDNSVERWSRRGGEETWTRTARRECAERCALYAMALSSSDTWDELCVAGGTIFNDIQVWGVSDGVVRARCVGHEGSLMRVRFGDGDDEVYSASDDRTARVWDVSTVMRDFTGERRDIRPSAVLVGHTARVWDCVRIDGERPMYASAGEDCTIRLWDANLAHGTETLSDGVDRRAACELATLRGHRGRGIWRLCALKSSNGESFLVSAGADGSVKLWSVSDWTRAIEGAALREFETPCPDSAMVVDEEEAVEMEPTETVPRKRKKSKRRQSFFGANDEFIRVVRIARYGVIYVATNRGVLHRVTQASEEASWIWTTILENASPILSMCLEETSENDVVLFSDLEGVVNVVYVSKQTGARVNNVSWSASEPRLLLDVFSTPGKVFASIVGGVMKCWNLTDGSYAFTLRNPYKHRALAVDCSEEQGLVLVGDQKGNLCVFDSKVDDELPLVAKKWSAHEKTSSVNSCKILPGPVFVSGGRDSNVCYWRMSEEHELVLDSKWTTPSKSGADFVTFGANGELARAAGFRETNFVVYSVSDQRQMMRVPVQAQHTPHDILMGDGDRVIFVHRQKTSLHILVRWPESIDVAEDESTALWSHGREIHTVRLVPPPAEAQNAPIAIITGAEDGTVMRVLYDSLRQDGARIYAPGDICRHPGGRTVKAVNVYKESEFSSILCAGGAKEVLLAFRLTWFRDDSGSWDIKSSALIIPKPVDKPGTRAWTKGCGYVEPRAESDQRIMDVATYSHNGEMRVLYSTSRGIVSVVAMDENMRSWRNVSSLHHHTSPALTVDVWESDRTWACSGSTDGSICLWRLDDSQNIAPAFVIERAHQSGVNALGITRGTNENTLMVVSGGDDQTLRAQEFRVEGERVSPLRIASCEFAHSSALRSLWTDGGRIVSTSVDQRVRLWNVSTDLDDFRIEQGGGALTQAPEPEDIDVLPSADGAPTLVIAGRGFELFDITAWG